MITLLDELLRDVLMRGVPGLQPTDGSVEAGQVGFEPPDDDWCKHVSSLQRNALNLYLIELSENRKLRSNERERQIEQGMVYQTPAPMRIDCHYLISAWTTGIFNPGSTQPALEPTIDEHRLLYEATAALAQYPSLIPSAAYPEGSPPLNAWPTSFRNAELPVSLAPPEGFGKLAEFWGTMGQKHSWKPVLHLIVTLPVQLAQEVAGRMVTSRITEYRPSSLPGAADFSVAIAGAVTAGIPPNPAPEAWVSLEGEHGELLKTTLTDLLGRFGFESLKTGKYRLRVRVRGYPEKVVNIEVPSSTGDYRVHLT